MLTEHEFRRWLSSNSISEIGAAYISRVRNSPPSRRPQNRAGGNVIGAYPSRKMGVTIGFESHTCEFGAIYLHERNPDVFEMWDQPESISLKYISKTGKGTGFLHTPDFLVIRKAQAVWQEWKYDSEIEKLAVKMPQRYVRRAGGGWSCPPGEEAGKEYGIGYEVHTTSELNRILLRNITFLEDYWRKTLVVSQKIRGDLLTIVAAQPGLSLRTLIENATKADLSADHVFALIADQAIYVDLESQPLADPDRVRIFKCPETAAAFGTASAVQTQDHLDQAPLIKLEPGEKLLWNGIPLRIVLVDTAKIMCQSEVGDFIPFEVTVLDDLIAKGELVGVRTTKRVANEAPETLKIILSASPNDLKVANARWAAVGHHISVPITEKNYKPGGIPLVTLRLWKRSFLSAQARTGNGYLGLLPKKHPGNTSPRLTKEVEEQMTLAIEGDYENSTAKNATAVYGRFLETCKAKGIVPPTIKTFKKWIRDRPRVSQARKRGGKRAAYAEHGFYFSLDYETPRHGDRPFEIAHIDHTEIDLEFVCPTYLCNLGKAWVTLLTDAYSRRVLANYVTFEKPSFRSCMAVLRLCVKRHQRLPQILVMDNGAEFRSGYLDGLLAMYEVTKKLRPPARARFGSVLERMFRTTNDQLIHNLRGNTKIMRNVRQVTKGVNPKNLAQWDLESFYDCFCHYFYEIYDTSPHGTLLASPREAYESARLVSGLRSHYRIPYDELFKMLTLPTTARGEAKVQPSGVMINYLYYWCEEFVGLRGETLSVRYDPFDVSVAYVYSKKRWIKCISQLPNTFRGMTEKQLMNLASAYRQVNKHAKTVGKAVTARKLAEFSLIIESKEEFQLSRRRELSNASVRRAMDGEGLRPQPTHIVEPEEVVDPAPRSATKKPTTSPAHSFSAKIDDTFADEEAGS